MLDDYRSVFKQSADIIPGWETMNKNDLCRDCLKHQNDPLYDNYIAALMCRYWPLIAKYYNQSLNLAEPDDCYSWLVDSIMYALKHKQWENPTSNIYQDPQGPDKVINRCMKSSRLIFYQFKNRKKRRKEYQLVSIEDLKETINTDIMDMEDGDTTLDHSAIDIEFMIEHVFKQKEYFLAFLLDCICSEDVFDIVDNQQKFNIKKLSKYFRNIDEAYLRRFSTTYSIPYDQVYQAAILAKNIPDAKVTVKIEETLLRLKHSEIMKNFKDDIC